MSTQNSNEIVNLSDGRQILLSYGTPVAAFIPGRGYLRRARRYSVTTSKHVNRFAGREAPEVAEDEWKALVAPLKA